MTSTAECPACSHAWTAHVGADGCTHSTDIDNHEICACVMTHPTRCASCGHEKRFHDSFGACCGSKGLSVQRCDCRGYATAATEGYQARDSRTADEIVDASQVRLMSDPESALTALGAPSSPAPLHEFESPSSACFDCGRRYGDSYGFPDLVVPHDVWAKISPRGDEGGLLCPSCMCRRAEALGIQCPARFTSGPFCVDTQPLVTPEDIALLKECAYQYRYGGFGAVYVNRPQLSWEDIAIRLDALASKLEGK